jgi:hypothetical protein
MFELVESKTNTPHLLNFLLYPQSIITKILSLLNLIDLKSSLTMLLISINNFYNYHYIYK